MKNETYPATYQEILLNAFKERQKADLSYNLRRFAKDIQISPQNLSMVLKGKSGLSALAAKKISQALGFPSDLEDFFTTLVSASHQRSKTSKTIAKEKLRKQYGQRNFEVIAPEEFDTLSEWYHWAIFNLVEVKDFKPDPEWIACRLGITTAIAKKSCDFLFNCGMLIEKEGRWEKDSHKMAITMKGKSAQLQKVHAQLLDKATKSVNTEVSQRHLTTAVLSLTEHQFETARQKLAEFARSMITEFSEDESTPERVAGLSLQFFYLDK